MTECYLLHVVNASLLILCHLYALWFLDYFHVNIQNKLGMLWKQSKKRSQRKHNKVYSRNRANLRV